MDQPQTNQRLQHNTRYTESDRQESGRISL